MHFSCYIILVMWLLQDSCMNLLLNIIYEILLTLYWFVVFHKDIWTNTRVDTKNTYHRLPSCQVYHVAGGARQGKSHFWPHSGVHLLVTGHRGEVMMRQRFLTYQPAEHVDLAAALAALQPGRVVILAGVVRWCWECLLRDLLYPGLPSTLQN